MLGNGDAFACRDPAGIGRALPRERRCGGGGVDARQQRLTSSRLRSADQPGYALTISAMARSAPPYATAAEVQCTLGIYFSRGNDPEITASRRGAASPVACSRPSTTTRARFSYIPNTAGPYVG
jgi:hypothetical protein